jgi:hypothetical protein
MSFAGNGLMINKQRGGYVGETMKQFPIFSADGADRPIITR